MIFLCLTKLNLLQQDKTSFQPNIFIVNNHLMASPSELFSCVDAKAILLSPTNDSTAKNHWTFAKDARFKSAKIYCDSFYKIPGIKQNDRRKAGFGYGKKTDLDYGKNPQHVVPSPDTYKIASFADTNKTNSKGFTPRFSREEQEIAPMSYIDLQQAKVPGPGRYNEFKYNQSPKWSLRPRVDSDIFPQTTVKIVPGPGNYENTEALNLTGKYHLSNHKCSKSKVFNPPRSRRFYKSTTDVPGPGSYTPVNDMSNEGKYILSKNVSAGKRTFMDGRRNSFTQLIAKRSQTPGPGSYRAPSDFGHYDEKVQRTMSKSQMANRGQNTSKTDRTKNTSAV